MQSKLPIERVCGCDSKGGGGYSCACPCRIGSTIKETVATTGSVLEPTRVKRSIRNPRNCVSSSFADFSCALSPNSNSTLLSRIDI